MDTFYTTLGAFLGTFLLGVVILATAWWQGANVSWKFMRWYFGIFFVIALGVGIYTYVTTA
ncbi:hypothetical protein [Cohnella sp. AR92]|uniref:hypothetical protein n=1 Tax=Cohnella sp. AR92 TaxID=648716 RepID=UPI000F8C56C0|nr:hypothetical protein [Cohnella sp. AR92]RUS45010.1 hypothetical protein ELR57_20935 [Cohnella sp. AR92]